MSCPECCMRCCPCLAKTKKASKFNYVRYSQAQPQISDTVKPDKVFEFPQNKSDFNTHPQMFEVPKTVIRYQPRSEVRHQPTPAICEQPTSAVCDQPSEVCDLPVPKSHLDATDGTKLHAGGNVSKKRLSLPNVRSIKKHVLPKSSTLPRCDEQREKMQSRKGSYVEVETPNSPFDLPTLEEYTLQQDDQLAMLQFSLLYNMQRNLFTVHLHHASNLPETDRKGPTNPFVVLYMMPNKEEVFESVAINHTLNPRFDQSFEFHHQHPDDIQRRTLILKVYDNSKSRFIGGVAFPLESADIFGVVVRMKIHQDFSEIFQDGQGDMLLALSYDQMSSSLKGVLLKATNLVKQDILGSADPYFKIFIYHNNKIIGKWKSTVKKKTLIPIFNESFQFNISEQDIENISMRAVLMDYDRFTKNDEVGTVLIGNCVSSESGRKHWKEMILNPNSSVCQWHTII